MSDSPHILFIDGNQKDRQDFAQRLQRCSRDFVVFHAATGRSGLTICERQFIDCVVLELVLPDRSGFEVLLKLVPRVRQPDTAVIILTRLSNHYLLAGAVKYGAQAAFYKTMASGNILHRAVLKAMATVERDRKRYLTSP